jgi:DNA-binding FadR family transcriptional regulator
VSIQAAGGRAQDRRRSPKTSEIIARELANQIIDDDLPAGARLPTERDMVEHYGVGRTTLREALRLLETRGVITIRSGPRGGPVVRRPRPNDLSESLTLILQFEEATLGDVLEARRTLEPSLSRLACSRIDKALLSEIVEANQAILDNLDDHDVFLSENQRFHSLIAGAAGNVVLQVFNETLKSIADGATVGVEYTPARRKAVAEAHLRIIEALEAGDPAAAEEAMHAHLDEAGAYWRRRYGNLVTRPVRWVQ